VLLEAVCVCSAAPDGGNVVTECVPTGVYLTPADVGYLAVKASRAARTLDPPSVRA